ncbi:arthropod defensin [Actinomyces sp. 2119]|uniref:actinodefensin n=1 Tax=Actinomyces sp. 2119 TaxID=2321393 RepID=UPI000E6BB1A1|nr:actinodefensin [Actinomyces sp. 2119]RJF41981.1 arthropod defensin [Actinomyces sp. 2119]
MPHFIRRTTTLAGADFTQALRSETHAPTEGAEPFGCPALEFVCNRHCRSIARNYYKGKCVGMFKQTCKCFSY